MVAGKMLGAVLACGVATGVASAQVELLIDINSLAVQATDIAFVPVAFGGLTHTGSVVVNGDGDSVLAGVSIDGVSQPTTPGLSISYTGRIDLFNGTVTGGFLDVTMSDASRYTALITPLSGMVVTQAGQGFLIDGLTFEGIFSDNGAPALLDRFAGVNIAPWANAEPLFGSFINFAFSPSASGFDADANLDIFVYVPSPTGAALFAAAGAFAGLRRRR